MAFFPAIPFLGKALTALKAGGAAAKTALGAKAAGTQLTIPGLAAGGKMAATKRFAGNALEKIVGKELMSQPTELAFRLAPDVVFGTMSGIATPGDLGDKLIAGTTQALGGGLTGIAAGRGARAIGMGERAAGMVDLGASFAGDMMGMQVGDALMRAKGGGTTPWERQQMEADAQYRAQLEDEFRRKYGVGGQDPFLADNGLV